MMIYIPYSLNNTMDLGSEVSYCTFYMQTTGWRDLESEKFSLNQGWNRIKWDYSLSANETKEINLLEIRIWNRMWVYNDDAKVLIDDIKFGGSNQYSSPNETCSSSAIQLSSCTIDGQVVASNAELDENQIADGLYPNPTTGVLYLPYEQPYFVYNSQGYLIGSGDASWIDLSSQKSGIYLVKLSGETHRVSKR
jgi:hypothetical protein